MAYSTITNSEIAVGAPITNSLMIKLRDNPEAIATGAAGATRIQAGAIDDGAVTPSNMQAPTAGTGNFLRYVNEDESQTQNSSYGPVSLTSSTPHALIPGTITVYFQHYSWPAEETSYVRILKNGTEVASFSTTAISYVTKTSNVTVVAGDAIHVQHRSTGVWTGGSSGSFLRRVRIYSNSESVAVA